MVYYEFVCLFIGIDIDFGVAFVNFGSWCLLEWLSWDWEFPALHFFFEE